jgi:UDP-N-acetylmuramyl pentapeptide phosphotransferase/UDP-N-acetylglucosamine-1-phosphate transferase
MIFTNLDAGLDGVYGGLAMIYGATMAFTGLVMTRLAPQDERV